MGKFTFHETKIKGVYIVEPTVYKDSRGYFMEAYNAKHFQEAGIETVFVQDNESCSRRGVLRGLHFQKTKQQAKLVRVTKGEVFDVCVDLRRGSKTYGQWESAVLSAENKKQLYIPKGFAHGFLVLSDIAEFNYKCSDFYDPTDESGFLWNSVGIDWPECGCEYMVSTKDAAWERFS